MHIGKNQDYLDLIKIATINIPGLVGMFILLFTLSSSFDLSIKLSIPLSIKYKFKRINYHMVEVAQNQWI